MRFILGFCFMVYSVLAAQADTLLMSIESNHPNVVSLEFYSQDHNRSWPGDGKSYRLDDNQTHEYKLQCEAGETICFGAWVHNQSDTYWGVGLNNSQRCTDCCYICGGRGSKVRVLNP